MTEPTNRKPYRSDVAHFISQLNGAPPSQHEEMTKTEIQRLKATLSLASLKTYLSLRRTAVLETFGSHHVAYDLLRLSDDEYAQLRDAYQASVSQRQAQPIRVRHTKEMLATATALLASDDAYALILGLALVTGRRSYEIAGNPEARLDPVSIPASHGRVHDKWSVRFRGQVKTKGAEGTMANKVNTIPVLAPATLVIDAFDRLRSKVAPNLVGMDYETFNRATNTPLNRRCKAVFGPFWVSSIAGPAPEPRPGTAGRGKTKLESASISTRDLRIIYAEICSRMFNMTGTPHEQMKPSEYYARILGHRENDLTTAQSYSAVVIEDLPGPSEAVRMAAGIADARARAEVMDGATVAVAQEGPAEDQGADPLPPIVDEQQRVLDVLRRAEGPRSALQVAKDTGLPRNRALGILKELEATGQVARANTKKQDAGWQLAEEVEEEDALSPELAQHLVNLLPDETFETYNSGHGEIIPKSVMHNAAFFFLRNETLLEKRLVREDVQRGMKITISTWGLSESGKRSARKWAARMPSE